MRLFYTIYLFAMKAVVAPSSSRELSNSHSIINQLVESSWLNKSSVWFIKAVFLWTKFAWNRLTQSGMLHCTATTYVSTFVCSWQLSYVVHLFSRAHYNSMRFLLSIRYSSVQVAPLHFRATNTLQWGWVVWFSLRLPPSPPEQIRDM